jgi:pyruvate,orthophosphate dikinase
VLGPDRPPAGVTITTEACVAYMNAACTFPEALDEKVADGPARLEERARRRLSDHEPLLVSVRSGGARRAAGAIHP